MKACPGCGKAIPPAVIEKVKLNPRAKLKCSSCGTRCSLHEVMAAAGRTARDEALERVDKHADRSWKEVALDVVRHLAATRETFTTDDVWRELEKHSVSTHEPRAIGAVMRSCASSGMIRNTKRAVESTREECHRRPVTIWESLLAKR